MWWPASLDPIFRVWRHRNFALFNGGEGVYCVTLWMQRVGVGWLAWELTQSTAWLGILAAADLGPMLVLAPLAGATADRVNPLNQVKIVHALSLLQAVLLSVVMFAGWMSIEVLVALTMALGCLHPFMSAARHSVLPGTVPRTDFAAAIGINSALFHASRSVGPAFAALIIPLAGVGGAFVANIIGATLFLIAVLRMDLAPPPRTPGRIRTIFRDIGDGLAYVGRHPGIGPLFLVVALVSFSVRPVEDMLPGFAGDVFQAGPAGLAWLTSGMGIGATASAIWIALRGPRRGLTRVVLLSSLGVALALLAFTLSGPLWLAAGCALLVGFALTAMSTAVQAMTQLAVANEMRGRVMSLYTMIFRGMPAFGAVAAGLLAEVLGLRVTFALGAAFCVAAWACILPRRLRRIQAGLESEQR